jgi:hypothetical protein
MKALRKATYKRTMLDLDEWVASVQGHADVIFDWKSQIHLRLIIDGYWLDLWPTTGKWYDFYFKRSGTGIQSMSESVGQRLDTRPFVLSFVPHPPSEPPAKQPRPHVQPPPEEERLFTPSEMALDPTFDVDAANQDDLAPW